MEASSNSDSNRVKTFVKSRLRSFAYTSPILKNILMERDDLRLALRETQRQLQTPISTKVKITWPVVWEDLVQVNQVAIDGADDSGFKKAKPPFTINFVIPPISAAGGGHINVMNFVQYLESRNHTCRIYNYDPFSTTNLKEIKKVFKKSYPNVKAEILYGASDIAHCDAIFATGWDTAYPVFNFAKDVKKFYFVQDFEPLFYPSGPYSILAENTYKFKFHGITAGKWLSKKLSDEYGMKCDYYDFSADTNLYNFQNPKPRKKVLFYTRPVTPRRGFELGIAALTIFHELEPDYEINLIGWDASDFDLPFPHKNLGTQPLNKLNEYYNEAAAGLVVSLSNFSLLPLELLASGCIPVVNEGDNNQLVGTNEFIEYAPSYPADLAAALSRAVRKASKDKSYSRKISEGAAGKGWKASHEKIEKIIERELHG